LNLTQLLHWLPIGIFIVLGILMAVLVVAQLYYIRKDRNEMEPLAASLGGKYVTTKLGSYIRLPGWGPELRLETDLGGDDLPPYLLLSVQAPLDFDLDISPRTGAVKVPSSDGRLEPAPGRKLEKVDLSQADPGFDKKYAALSTDPERAKAFLLAGKRIELADQFFAKGFTWIKLEKGNLFLQKAHHQDEDFSLAKVGEATEMLKRFLES
jgi:hypothetical protein